MAIAGGFVQLRCMLGAKAVFDRSEMRYHLCKLYVDDYCVWLQSASASRLATLGGQLALQLETLDVDRTTGWSVRSLLAAAGVPMDSGASQSSSDDDSSSSDEDDDSSSDDEDDDGGSGGCAGGGGARGSSSSAGGTRDEATDVD